MFCLHADRYQVLFGVVVELCAFTWMIVLLGSATSGEHLIG